jgi:hypothetical protein
MGCIEIFGKPEVRVFTSFDLFILTDQKAVFVQIVPLLSKIIVDVPHNI